MRKLMSPGLLGATALGALIVASAMGIRLDAKAFFVNVLAGIACLVLGVATALVLVDRYVAYKRRKQWEGVEAVTLNAIAVHLCEITGSMFLHFRMPFGLVEPFFAGHSKPLDRTIVRAFDPLLSALRKSPSSVTDGESGSDAAVEYYDKVKWDLDQIQGILTPRVLESPAEQVLINRLIEFDQARRKLHHAIIAHEQAVTQSVYAELVTMIEQAKVLYNELLTNAPES